MFQPVHHSMLRRCHNWDYKSPGIYMITLTLENRTRPLLGRVLPIFPREPSFSPQQIQAKFEPTPLGLAIIKHWQEFPAYVPEIRPLFLQVMEEHLHGILRVIKKMPHALGNAIGGFKTWCNRYYKTATPAANNLFSEGFQDTILFQEGQLPRMFHYLQDNPRRLAIRRLFPDLFVTVHNLERGGGTFSAYGNSFLLDKYLFYLLQVSRTVTDSEMSLKRAAMFQAVAQGATIVSACISPGERILMREAMDAGASLIALKNNGFPPLYKPAGKFFDACAAGRLLLLAPTEWGTTGRKKNVTREQCCVMNALAAKIAGGFPQDIRYHGCTPTNLEDLIHQAGF